MKQLIIAAVVVMVSATSMSAQTVTSTSAVAVKHVGAPGPLIGAGPVGLVIGVGYGVYWLRKRRRKAG